MPRLTSFSQSFFAGINIARSFDPSWTLSSVTKAFSDNVAATQYSFNDTTYAWSWADLHFSPNGDKFYILAKWSNSQFHVFEYNLTTEYDLSTASYIDKFNIHTNDSAATGIFFKPDGTKMFVAGDSTNQVQQYSLSTAWDISSLSYDSTTKSLSDSSPDGIFFKPDGTEMYVLDNSVGAGGIRAYPLSTAWDITTAGTTSFTTVISSYLGNESSFCFSSDGTKVYVGGQTGVDAYEIHEFTLSTAWDVTTTSYTSTTTTTDGNYGIGNYYTQGLSMSSNNTKLFVLGSGGIVYSLALSTPKDLSTGLFDGNSGYLGDHSARMGVFFKSDGTKLYTANYSGNKIFEWSLSTAWDVTSAGSSSEFDLPTAVSPNSSSFLQDLYFSPDGTKLFTIHDGADLVFGFDLSTAWDITTASFNGTNKMDPAHNQAHGLFFKPDGTKAFFMDVDGTIRLYNLSTAWDLTTAVYGGGLGGSSLYERNAGNFTINPDGTKMFITGLGKGTSSGVYWPTVTEYNLSNPWALNGVTYANRYYDLTFMFDKPEGIYVDPDGERMFLTNSSGGRVYKFNLVPPPPPAGYWFTTYGNSDLNIWESVAVDSSGDIVVGGTAAVTGEGRNFYIGKYNSYGQKQWDKILNYPGATNTASNDATYRVRTDSSNNIYFTGALWADTQGSNDVILGKFNSSGTLQWARGLGGTSTDKAYGMAIDSSDNIILAGDTGSVGGLGSNEQLIIKYNSSGNIQWQRYITTSGYDTLSGIVTDASNNIYVSGEAQSKGFIAKYNSSGTLQWQKTYPISGSKAFFDLAIDSLGNLICLGYSNGYSANGNTGLFVFKMDSSGSGVWFRHLDIGATGSAYPSEMAIDSSDNIIITGYIAGITPYKGIIIKYNSSGTIQWQRDITGASNKIVNGITLNSSDDMILAGWSDNGSPTSTVAQLPSDGSLTGTYGNYTYQSASYTGSTSGNLTTSTSNYTNGTASLTSYTSSPTVSAPTGYTETKDTVV